MSKVAVFEYFPEESIIALNLPDGSTRQIRINPGWAFGKGYHPTTKLCVKSLEDIFGESGAQEKQVGYVLDIGCGSGVLSICAAALGAARVTGLDIDRAILNEAESNVEMNGFSPKIDIRIGSPGELGGQFDLVVANILIDSIVAISAEITGVLNPGALLVTSGIKESEKHRALERFDECGLLFEKEYREGDWVALRFRNPGD